MMSAVGNCRWESNNKKINSLDDSLMSLLTSNNIYMIKFLISNNLISVNDISDLIKKYCESPIAPCNVIELVDLLINIGSNVSVLQQMFVYVLRNRDYLSNRDMDGDGICDNEYSSIIQRLIEHGAIISADPEVFCFLPDKIFIEYISSNCDLVTKDLELKCAKYKSYAILEHIQNILEIKGITLTDPLTLFIEAYTANNLYDDLLQKITLSGTHDKSLLNKMFFVLRQNSYEKIFDNTPLSAEMSLAILIHYGGYDNTPKYLIEYLDSDVMKYKDVDFYEYFYDENSNMHFHNRPKKRYYPFRCTDSEANKIYFNLMMRNTNLIDILRNDDLYNDIIKKYSVLLNSLKQDPLLNVT